MRTLILSLAFFGTFLQNTLARQPYLNYSAPIDLAAPKTLSYDYASFSINSQEPFPGGLTFSLIGQQMFVVGGQIATFAKISEFTLDNYFDVTSGVSFSGNSFSLNSYESRPQGIAFDLYGDKMFIVGTSKSEIHEFALPSAFDFSSGVTYNGTPGGNSYEDIAFNLDGTKMLVLSNDANVRQYSLTLPYDVINPGIPSYDGTAIDISGEESEPGDFAFNANGTKMFILGAGSQQVHQYSLSSPFDITAGVSYDGVALDISDKETMPTGLTFDYTNTHMYVVGRQNKTVYQYSQSSDVFIETSGNNGEVEGSMILTLMGHTFSNASGTLTSPTHFTINNLPAGLTPSIAVHSSGKYGVLTLAGNATEWENVSALNFTFTNDAFASVGAAGIINAITGNSKLGIRFNKRAITYSSAIDLTNTTKVIHNSKSYDLSNSIGTPAGMAFSNDGLKLFVTGLDPEVHEYQLLNPFNITVSTFHQPNPLDVSSELTFPQDIAFNDDGTKMYVLGSVEKEINQYSLHTPFTISSGVSFDGSPLSLSSEGDTPAGFAFAPDGSKLFVVGVTGKALYQYNLTKPYDVTSGTSYSGTAFDLSNENDNPRGISFNSSGTKLFVVSEGDDEINTYSLTVPFDITSGVIFDGTPMNVSSVESNPVDIAFNPSGSRMFILGNGDNEINQFSMAFGFEEAAANDGSVAGQGFIRVHNAAFVNAGSTLSPGTHFSITNLPSGLTPQIAVFADGHSAAITLSGNATAHDYADGVGNLKLTFEDAAFSNGGVSYIENAEDGSTGWFVSFKGAPSMSYHPSIDITKTNALVDSDNHFDLSGQEMTPYNLTFNDDGSKMYVVGYEEKGINQFSLSNPFDITTGVTFDGSPLDLSADGFVPVGMAFTPSGEKLIVVGIDGDLKQYNLSTPYETTSGVTFAGEGQNLQSEINNCSGFAFSNDGMRLFALGNGAQSIAQYDLPAYYYVTDGLTYSGDLLDLTEHETNPSDFAFSPDGKKLLVASGINRKIHQYSLSIPFDLTSDVTYDGNPYNIPATAMRPNGMTIVNKGQTLFIVGPDEGFLPTKREINQFAIEVNGFYEATINDGHVEGGLSINIAGETFTNSGGALALTTDYTITPIPAGLTPQLAVEATGRSAFLTLTGQANDHEDANDVADLTISFANSAFAGNDASGVANSTTASTGTSINFRDNNTPIFLSANTVSVEENSTDILLDIEGTDGEGSETDANINYTISGGVDEALFNIDPANGELSFVSPPDFEAPADANTDNIYVVEVTIDDGSTTNGTASQTITITVTDLNELPIFQSVTSAVFAENGTEMVLDIDASDEGGAADEGVIYFTSGGADQNKFTMQSTANGHLHFISAPDFETPADANGDNVYELEVTARDNTFQTSIQVITITVTDINEAPVFTSSGSPQVPENIDGTVIDINANDGDAGNADEGITYSLNGGVDKELFNIETALGILTFKSPPDYENPVDADLDNGYLIEVTANDGVFSTTQSLTVTITNENEPPFFISANAVTHLENEMTFVIDIDAKDGDGAPTDEQLSYSLTGGPDLSLFSVAINNGYLYFNSAPDFENPKDDNNDNTYTIEVTANDGVNTAVQELIISVSNVDEVPVFATGQQFSFPENSNEAVADVDAQDGDNGDVDEGISYSIVGGNDQQYFAIDVNLGVVRFVEIPDYENPLHESFSNNYDIEIQASDGANTATQYLYIKVTNVDEAPQFPVIEEVTFPENSNDVVIDLNANDGDGGFQDIGLIYSISGGSDMNAFSIDPTAGLLRFGSAPDFENPADADKDNTYHVIVKASEGTLATEQALIIVVTNEDDNLPPVIGAQTFTIPENSFAGFVVGTVLASDTEGAALTFTILQQSAEAFAISSATGELTVASAQAMDFESTPAFELVVQVTDDQGSSASATISVILTDVDETGNHAPTVSDVTFTIPENSAMGTLAGNVAASDEDGDELFFAIVDGNLEDAFAIGINTGQITVQNASALDFEANPVFLLMVEVSDGKGGFASAEVTINLGDVNESGGNSAPIIQARSISIKEHSPNGFLVATITASDVDADPLTYSIQEGNLNNAFAINQSSGELTINNTDAVDFETTPQFDLLIVVDDANGGSASAVISVLLEDIDESLLGTLPGFDSFRIYPIPTSKNLFIEFSLVTSSAMIQIADLTGNIVYSTHEFKVRSVTVPLDGIPHGVYIVRLTIDSGVSRPIRILKN